MDVSADEGWLTTVLRTMLIVQMVIQGRWIHDCPLLTLPGIEKSHLSLFRAPDGSSRCIDGLPELAKAARRDEKYLPRVLNGKLSAREIDQVKKYSIEQQCVAIVYNKLVCKGSKHISYAGCEGFTLIIF